MPSFTYRAYAPGGSLEEKTVDEESASVVHADLRSRGYRVISLRPTRKRKAGLHTMLPSLFKVKAQDLVLFSRQLATFVGVAVPITDALHLIRDEASSPVLKAALDDVCEDLDLGESLSVALAHHPHIFNRLYIDLVLAAEVSGDLEPVLLRLANYISRQESALKKLRSAMIYPAVILSLAISVATVLIVFVLPNFISIFQEFHAALPPPTRLLITVGEFGSRFQVVIIVSLVSVVLGSVLFFRSPRGKVARDYILLRVPLLGRIVRFSIIERFARTLAAMLKAGIPIAQTFEVASTSAGNAKFERGLAAVKTQMETGEGFARPLSSTGLFPPMVIQMIRVGEETGTLPVYLDQIADMLSEEIEYKVKNMVNLIEPAMIIGVGLIVGFIGISVITPMYGLLRAIH
jgi:type IV pilus assembly protein PilC